MTTPRRQRCRHAAGDESTFDALVLVAVAASESSAGSAAAVETTTTPRADDAGARTADATVIVLTLLLRSQIMQTMKTKHLKMQIPRL